MKVDPAAAQAEYDAMLEEETAEADEVDSNVEHELALLRNLTVGGYDCITGEPLSADEWFEALVDIDASGEEWQTYCESVGYNIRPLAERNRDQLFQDHYRKSLSDDEDASNQMQAAVRLSHSTRSIFGRGQNH